MFKDKKIIMAVLIVLLLPTISTMITGKAENQVSSLISALPVEILLTIVIGYMCYVLGFQYTGIKMPKFNKLYYLIPEIILIIIFALFISMYDPQSGHII